MGNYSYFLNQEGCELDIDKLKVLLRLRGVKEYLDGKEIKCSGSNIILTSDNLGEFIDGWKIQGYWYEEFVEFLYCCLDCMKDLTDKWDNNFIEMEEEQGFKFTIFFYKNKGKPIVRVDFVPMEWQTMILKRKD